MQLLQVNQERRRTYEALYDFDNAIETIRKLDHLPEDKQRVMREVARLTEKKRHVDTTTILDWSHPHPDVNRKK